MNDGDDVVANFMAITGSAEDEAIGYLADHNFDLSEAVVSYQVEHPQMASERTQLDNPSPSVDSGSPTSVQPPMSYPLESYGSPTESHRPPTPPGQRTLGSGSNEVLQRMFARPTYVDGSDSASLTAQCVKAAERRCWIVVAVVDNSFPCECFTRDVWASDAMRSLTSGSIFCFEANVTHAHGMTIAEKYGVDVRQLPQMFIVDPVTKFKVEELPLVSTDAWRFDAALVVDALMLFITSHNPPHDPFANGEESQGPEASPDHPLGPPHAHRFDPLVVDVDSESEMTSPPTVSSSAAGVISPSAVADVPRPESFAVLNASPIVAAPPVTLDDYTVADVPDNTALVFKLRCRLPHSAPTLQLRPDTPVTKLTDYLAYVLHTEDKDKYAAPPSISIFSGFPPRNVTTGPMEGVTLATWAGVRSGDVLLVRVNT